MVLPHDDHLLLLHVLNLAAKAIDESFDRVAEEGDDIST
jgi:hypothetical protein